MTCAQYANTLYVLLQAEELIDQMDVQISEVEEEDHFTPVYFTSVEVAFFTDHDILLDNEASISIFRNSSLLTEIDEASRPIMLQGVQKSAQAIRVSREGTPRELGKVYISEQSSANILSFASLIDAGSNITYDQSNDTFILIANGGGSPYIFSRKTLKNKTGKFYYCDSRHLPAHENQHALLQTTVNAREIAKAKEARELLARLAFPPTLAAAQIVETGSNFGVTRRDFQNADSIWGPDVASIKGKSTWTPPHVPVATLHHNNHTPKQQTLSIDIH